MVESRKVDPTTRVLLQKQRIEGARVTYDKLTGNFQVPGKGKVALWNREDDAENPLSAPTPAAPKHGGWPHDPADGEPLGSAPRPSYPCGGRPQRQPDSPAAAGRAKPAALLPLKATVISFDTEMTGRYIAGKDNDTVETRWATFLGDVQTLHATVANENTQIDFDHPPMDYVLLNSQQLNVSSTPTPGKATAARNNLIAVTEAQARTRKETIKADVITYDSQKGLFHAYAEGGRPVVLIEQSSTGQPVTSSSRPGDEVQPQYGRVGCGQPHERHGVRECQDRHPARPRPRLQAQGPKTPRIRARPQDPGPQPDRTSRGMTGRCAQADPNPKAATVPRHACEEQQPLRQGSPLINGDLPGRNARPTCSRDSRQKAKPFFPAIWEEGPFAASVQWPDDDFRPPSRRDYAQ